MSTDASEDGCEWYFGVPFPSKRAQATAPATQERDYKDGDRVKVVKRGEAGSGHGANVGDIGKVFATDPGRVYCEMVGGPWYFYIDEIELLPPTFASGARVRVVRNTNRYAVGDTGTVTVANDENVGVLMDEGRYWSFKPDALEVVHGGGPDCAGRNGEQGPKFKAGDVVCANSTAEGQFTKGSTYVVRDDQIGETIAIERDDRGSKTNGWNFKFFDLVHAAPCPQDNEQTPWRVTIDKDTDYITGFSPAQPCIVIRQVDGQPRPASWPHVHKSAADATKEAERLASVNPGKQFDVYQRVTGRVAEQHIEMKVA